MLLLWVVFGLTTAVLLLFRRFPHLWSAYRFQSPRSPVLCFFNIYSFLLHDFSYNNRSTSVSVFLCFRVHPLPCSDYYIFFSLSMHMHNNLSLASLIFSVVFATPALAHVSSFLTILLTILNCFGAFEQRFYSARTKNIQ